MRQWENEKRRRRKRFSRFIGTVVPHHNQFRYPMHFPQSQSAKQHEFFPIAGPQSSNSQKTKGLPPLQLSNQKPPPAEISVAAEVKKKSLPESLSLPSLC